MKRFFSLVPMVFLAAALSGCSLSGTSTIGTTGQTAVVKTSSLWKSEDGGTTWQPLSDSKININQVETLSLIVDPIDSRTVYVGLRGAGILKTTDGGTTWNYLKLSAEKIYGLAVDPNDPETILASGVWQGRGKLWKSSDGGENWEEIYTASADGPLVISLAMDNSGSKNVFVATSDNQVLKSADGGTTWKKILIVNNPIIKIGISGNNPSLIMLLSNSGDVWKSQDGGNTFNNISFQIKKDLKINAQFQALEFDNSGKIYLGGQEGIICSQDSGASWKEVVVLNDPNKSPVTSIAVNPKKPDEIIYGASLAIYKSTNDGETWMPFELDAPSPVKLIRYSSDNPEVLYMGTGK